jgi:hypothetical protein
MEGLSKIAVAVAIALASVGHLPKLINAIRRAEFQLIQGTKASTWPTAPMLKSFKRPL